MSTDNTGNRAKTKAGDSGRATKGKGQEDGDAESDVARLVEKIRIRSGEHNIVTRRCMRRKMRN